MKQLTLIVLLFLTHAAVTHAQFKVLAEGPVFEEPEDGYARILQLKNGNTIFFHITLKKGIDVKVYDAKHKSKAEKHIEPQYGKLKSSSVEGIFEINGDAAVFISEVDDKKPVLYRLIVDGTTGTLKKEEQIAELKKLTMGQGYAMAFGGVSVPDFYIRKDPNSDTYALAMFNSFESDRSKRIEIVLYGADHKEISRAYYSSPDEKFKYMKYIDMAVIGQDKVSVVAYAYNTRSSGGKESELVLATLDKGKKEVSLEELRFSKDMVVDGGIARYNPATKDVILLASVRANDKRNSPYEIVLAFIDPFSGAVTKSDRIYPEKANEKSMELFGKKDGFTGMPQNLFINNDGSFSIVYEETKVITRSGSSYSITSTELGHIAVSKFNTEGEEVNTYFIPKRQLLPETYLTTFYHSLREGSAQTLFNGNQFKSFAYLNTPSNIYVLFNDIERNGESALKGKLTTIQGVGECDGFYYKLNAKDILPARDFVFGQPEGKREHNLALFAISDYDREKNVYVTLKLEKDGREKGVKVVWLQPK
ncbi:MAG: hypothetical protein QM731_24815 [Chitinophagaceae bacterium]